MWTVRANSQAPWNDVEAAKADSTSPETRASTPSSRPCPGSAEGDTLLICLGLAGGCISFLGHGSRTHAEPCGQEPGPLWWDHSGLTGWVWVCDIGNRPLAGCFKARQVSRGVTDGRHRRAASIGMNMSKEKQGLLRSGQHGKGKEGNNNAP
jgi:hypothetical protein